MNLMKTSLLVLGSMLISYQTHAAAPDAVLKGENSNDLICPDSGADEAGTISWQLKSGTTDQWEGSSKGFKTVTVKSTQEPISKNAFISGHAHEAKDTDKWNVECVYRLANASPGLITFKGSTMGNCQKETEQTNGKTVGVTCSK